MCISRLTPLVVLVAFLCSCGRSALQPMGGTGAVGGSGAVGGGGGSGTGGSGASNGGGGGTTPEGCLPACLADLARDCQLEGDCVSQFSGVSYNVCYDNGVKVVATLAGGMGMVTELVTKEDGRTICYTATLSLMGQSLSVTYRDPRGRVVARVEADPTSMLGTVVCDGETFEVDFGDPACQGGPITTPATMCQMGTCRFP